LRDARFLLLSAVTAQRALVTQRALVRSVTLAAAPAAVAGA
jgi:hypothetical protein